MDSVDAAGVLMYRKITEGSSLHVLLNLQKGGWSTFGGRSVDGETAIETASRELHEETKGVFERSVAATALSTCSFLDSITPSGRTFRLYVLDWDSVDTFLSPDTFVSLFRTKDVRHMDACFKEAIDIEWIPASNLRRLRLRAPLYKDLKKVESILSMLKRSG